MISRSVLTMFKFNQNKKLDPKIRFQSYRFKQKLRFARAYKRPRFRLGGIAAESKISFWINFKTALAVLISGAVLLGIFYWPKLFFVKNINIAGLSPAGARQAQELVQKYFSRHKLWPQQNLLLLNAGRLKNYLLVNDADIAEVLSVKKKLPKSLTITLAPRFGQFSVQTPQAQFIISNDGQITQVSNATTSTSSNLTLIHLARETEWAVGQKAFGPELLNKILKIKTEIGTKTALELDFVSMDSAADLEAKLKTKNAFWVYIDWNLNLEQTLDKLKLVLADLSEADKKRLSYVDMRLANKSFVCFKNTPCAKTQTTNQGSATSTPASPGKGLKIKD